MNSIKKLKESMGCNTIRDDHGGGIIYQRVHMDKAEFDEMLAEVEEEYSGLQAKNAKLRELIADVHEALRADKAGIFHKLILANMEDDMRELGIEVSYK